MPIDNWYQIEKRSNGITHIVEPNVEEFFRCSIWHVAGRAKDLLIDTGVGVVSLTDQVGWLQRDQILAVATHTHFDHIGGYHEFSNRACHPLEENVCAVRYGIRTIVSTNGAGLKFEFVREPRIDIAGEKVAGIPIRCLTRRHCFAENFLANADRGLDESTLSRDAVDLAHMFEGWSRQDADAGLALATAAYGDAISRSLDSVIAKLREDRAYRIRCVEGLGIVDPDILTAGLGGLARI